MEYTKFQFQRIGLGTDSCHQNYVPITSGNEGAVLTVAVILQKGFWRVLASGSQRWP